MDAEKPPSEPMESIAASSSSDAANKQENVQIPIDDMKSEINDEKETTQIETPNQDSAIKLEQVFETGEAKPGEEESSKKCLAEDEKDDVGIDESEEKQEEEDEEPIVEHLDSTQLYRDPTFAELCSFFNTFAHLLGLKPISITKLASLFTTLIDGDVDKELVDLHVTLMRKIYLKSARADKWEKALQKFCLLAPGLESESRQLQRHNYVDIPLADKLTILKALCDSQFDWNMKFKENIANTFRYNELRIMPIGTDKTGQHYFLQIDNDLVYRVYAEEPDDMAGASWTLKASNDDELAQLIEELKSPEFAQKSKEEEEEEEAEIDEEQLLDQPNKEEEEKKKQRRPSSAGSGGSKAGGISAKIQLSEEERAKVRIEGKFAVFWDRFKKQENLNKRKLEREKRKKERLAAGGSAKNTTLKEEDIVEANEEEKEAEKQEMNEEMEDADEKQREEEKEEDGKDMEESTKGENDATKETSMEKDSTPIVDIVGEKQQQKEEMPELDEALLAEIEAEDRRRVLPRRSARSTAILNLKVLTTPRRRLNDSEANDSSEAQSTPPVAQKLGFVATAGSCSDEDSEEEESEEEDEDEGRTSDDEFYLDDDHKPKVRRVGRPPTSKRKTTTNKPRRNGKGGGAKGKGKKKGRGRQLAKIVHSKKPQSLIFVEEETSEDEETEDENKREEKERKKATKLSLCQRCRGGTQPELLLLCDSCDDAWHTFCLRPQLWFVPDGDWYCPRCEHSSLIRRLTFALVTVREERKTREKEGKKKAAEDRLKREMDFIGSQLNDIMPLAMKNEGGNIAAEQSSSEEEDEEEGGDVQRKSKKRAMKIVTSRTRHQRKVEKCYGPVPTIAESRSRRALNKVDYNFRNYDEQLQEAMEIIDPDAKLEEPEESGAGRGKDMQNILDAERKRENKADDDGRESGDEHSSGTRAAERNENAPARPPKQGIKKKGGARKQHKRLTDLDLDNATESDTDEWQQESGDEVEEDPEPSEDEYLPSERRRTGARGLWARHRSDDEFINDDSDPDYFEGGTQSRKRKGVGAARRGGWFTGRGTKGRGKQRGKGRKADSTTEDEEEENEHPSGSDDDEEAGPSKKRKKTANGPTRKWEPKASSSDEGEEDGEEEEESAEEMTETGRPLRRAAAKMKKKLKEINEDEEEEEESEEGEEEEGNEEGEEQQVEDEKPKEGVERLADRAVSALAKPTRKATKVEDDADEFQPDEEEEAAVDEEEEELEEELAEQVPDEEEEEEDKEESSSTSSGDEDEEGKIEEKPMPPMKGKRKASPAKAIPPAKLKPPARGRQKGGTAGKKGTKPALKKAKAKHESESSEEETDDEAVEEGKTKKESPMKTTKLPSPKRKIAEEPKASTSSALQEPQRRQTRQQVRCQQSTPEQQETVAVEKLAPNNDQKQQPPLVQPLKTELSQAVFAKEEQFLPKGKLSATASAKARSFESLKAPPKTTDESTVQQPAVVQVPTTKSMTMTSSSVQPQKEIPKTSIKPSNATDASTSATSSPPVKTVFQAVHPHQLSQYFLRPSNTPPPSQHPPPPSQRQIPSTTSQPQMPPPGPRFTLQPTPTASYAYPVPPSMAASIANGGPPPTFVTVGHHHMPAGGPPALMHPPQLPPGAIAQFPPHSQPTAYFVQQTEGPPQIIYQTLQPYTAIMQHPASSHHQSQQMQMQPGMNDPESLSHALAGAMNPEDL